MPTSSSEYGRAKFLVPDLGHDPGVDLHAKVSGSFGEKYGIRAIADALPSWYQTVTGLGASATQNIVHNFGLSLTSNEIKVLIWKSGVLQTIDQVQADFAITEVNSNTIAIQNITGSPITFSVMVFSFNVAHYIGKKLPVYQGSGNGIDTDEAGDLYLGQSLATSILLGKSGEYQQLVGRAALAVVTDSTTTGAAQTLPLPNSSILRVTNASLESLAGVTAPTKDMIIYLVNRTGATITILNNDSGATAANRFFTGTDSPLAISANAAVALFYDVTSSRWQVLGTAGGAIDAGIVQSQAAHGFVAADIGAPLRRTSGSFVKAQANSASNAEIVGFLKDIIDSDNFTYVIDGIIPNVGANVLASVTDGTTYYLSSATAGALSASEPVTLGHISLPCAWAVGTSLVVTRVRGLAIGTTTGSFSDASFEVYDNLDNTKKVAFQVSGVTTATTRILTIPNADGTIPLRDANNTWSGTQDFSAASVILPTSATTINGLFFSLAGPGDITLTSTGATNVTLPTTGTLASLAGTQTFSNKTFSDRIDVTEVAAPAAPGAGIVRTWAGTDSSLNFRTDTNAGEVLETQKVFNYLAKWQTANEDIGTVVSGLTATGNRTSNQTQWGSTNTANLTIRRLSDILAIRNSGYIYELYSPSSSAAAGLFIESPMFDIATEDLTNPIKVFLRSVGNILGHWDVQLIRYNSSGTYVSASNLRGGEATGMGSAGLPTGSNSATFDRLTLAWSAGDKAAIRFRRTNANTTVYIKDLQVSAHEVGFTTTITATLSPIALGTGFVDLTSFTLEPGTWVISLRGNMIVTGAQRNTAFITDQSGTNTGLSDYIGVGDTRFCCSSYDPNTNNVVQLVHPGLIVHVSQNPKTFYLKWQRYGNSIELFSGETHITVRRIG